MRITFPGLFDLQANGFAGVDFNAPGLTADDVSLALGADARDWRDARAAHARDLSFR